MSTNVGAPAPVAAPAAAAPSAPTIPTNNAPAAPAEGGDEISAEEVAALEAAEAAEAQAATSKEKNKAAKKVAEMKRKFQIKVDGREEEIELDLSNEEEVRKHLQLSKASSKRMQESAEMKKGVQELIETLRTNPLKVLADPRLGLSEEQRRIMAEQIINNEIEEMQKTPEQKEKERIQKEYEKLKRQVEDEKKAREDADFRRLQQEQAVSLDNEISQAIETSGLPKTARTVRYMAEALMFALQNNLDMKPMDLVPYIKKQTLGEFKEMISSLPDEEFESWLGKDQIGRIRKRSLQKLKSKPAEPSQIRSTGQTSKVDAPQEKVAFKDFFKKLGK